MTPERWQQVKAVFADASALEGEAQREFLARTCANDADLLAEVESLLTAHRTDAILDRPAVSYVSDDSEAGPERWIGKRIGAYELVALLGQGGMGQVYRARRVDAEYDKEVAIKLVPGGYPANFVLQRLRAERQILANLDHPNIARLIDGGATDGFPYLVMELVEGEPLDLYCEKRNLPIRERLRLFRDVCAAVSYAHQRLVVHRDLKPSNILVTADGTVKLLDFGIAKLLQAAPGDTGDAPTATMMRALTPGYSSPEQVLGKTITTSSDVYSLGVVLYGLLTGKSPYRSTLTSTEDVIREVCEAEPARPSEAVTTGGEAVSRDLDAICLRALRKEPDRRYRSADEFSEDVRRYLVGLPVLARGDQLSYRAGKFLRRRKLEIAASLLVGIALIGGLVASLRQARIAEQQRARAELHFASVRKLADVFMFEMHDAIKDLPGSTAARKLLLDKALEYLNTLAKDGDPDRGLRLELATAYQKVGDIQGKAQEANTGESAAALESYKKAIALLEPLVAEEPGEVTAQAALAQAHQQASRILVWMSGAKPAMAESAKAVAIYKQLVADDPSVENSSALTSALRTHTVNVGMTGDTAASVAFGTEALKIGEELARDHPADDTINFELGKAYSMAAAAITAHDNSTVGVKQAVAMLNKGLAIDEALFKASGGTNLVYARALLADHINLAGTLFDIAAYREAIAHGRAMIPLLKLMESDKGNESVRLDAAVAYWNLGHSLLAAGENAEAAQVFSSNIDAVKEVMRTEDNLQMQYVKASCEQGLATAMIRLAPAAHLDRAGRIKALSSSRDLYQGAIARFEELTVSVALNATDKVPFDEAIAGLKVANEELAKLGH